MVQDQRPPAKVVGLAACCNIDVVDNGSIQN